MQDQIEHYAENYDQKAEEIGWFGPEVLFGLAYKDLRAGQKVLDIGIGTGLSAKLFHRAGLKIYGMDISEKMLEAVKSEGITEELVLHDLTEFPYPYTDDFFDVVVCAGVFNFFDDLGIIFTEASRVLQQGGYFAFVVGYRQPDEDLAVIIGSEHTSSDSTVTMYRHSEEQIRTWLHEAGLKEVRSLEFAVFMDMEKIHRLPAKAHVVKKV